MFPIQSTPFHSIFSPNSRRIFDICSIFLFLILIAGNAHCGQVTLISPSGAVSENPLTYSWQALPGSIRYQFMAKDSSGRRINKEYTAEEAGCPSGEGVCSVASEMEFSKGPCKWRVRGWDGSRYSPWSGAMSFSLDQ